MTPGQIATPPAEADVAVVGAGLIGLATARAILRTHPSLRLVVLEKEPRIASHQSGHNSGVIHSGIYYQPGSLKAALSTRGGALLRAFCDTHAIPYRECGKLIIAVRESELDRLQNLYRRGLSNGLKDLQLVDARTIPSIEPAATGLCAVYSPHTAIVDYGLVAQALAGEIASAGGTILTGWPVHRLAPQARGWTIESGGSLIAARAVVSCAGLQSDRLATMTGAAREPRIVPFRGEYWLLQPRLAGSINGLIYPVPDPAFPFLGVHFTPRMNGEVWVGPNALLALAREGYRRRDVSIRDLLRLLGWSGFYRLIRRYWRMGVHETSQAFIRTEFLKELRRYVPTVGPDDLRRHPSGVRAQAVSNDGRLLDDFVFSEGERILHVRNAPSPAASACLAIGELIEQRLRH